MRNSGIEMDVVSYGTAVSACAKAGDVQGTLKLIKVWLDRTDTMKKSKLRRGDHKSCWIF